MRQFARVEPGETVLSDINAGIESCVSITLAAAYKKKLQILTDLSPLSPVSCNVAKINQVVLNLFINAIDACSEGGTVKVRTRADDGGVRIDVEDDGCGIETEFRDQIFEPFFTTKPAGKGTGLGLSMSRDIIRDHGGRIEFDSAPSKGSRFTVFLPVQSDAGPALPTHGMATHDFRGESETRKDYEPI
jgi:signal transduction histidine kinase